MHYTCPRLKNPKPLILICFAWDQRLKQVELALPVAHRFLPSCAAMAEAVSAQCCCCLCGLWYDEASGRQHGQKFTCVPCGNADRQLRRNLGSKSEIEQLPQEDQVQFFRRLQEEKKQGGKNLPWKTVRAQLVAMVTTRHITSVSTSLETEELPLSVWLTRGWEKEVIENCLREYSQDLKTYLYKVATKKSLWQETHERINERILRQEREATKSKSKKGKGAQSDGELDLPEARPGTDESTSAAKEAKSAEAALRKAKASNAKKNMVAAKCIGQLSNDLQALNKAVTKAVDIPEEIGLAAKEALSTLDRWVTAAKAMLQEAEGQSAKSGEVELPALPFDAGDVKTLHQTCAEVIKNLKSHMPAPKAKAGAKRKDPADAEAAAENLNGSTADAEAAPKAAPKRRVRSKAS